MSFTLATAENTDQLTAVNTDQLDLVDAVAKRSLKQRIDDLGVTDSGAYNFYFARIDRNKLTSDTEIRLRDLILKSVDNIRSIHDLGAGIGSLAMSFASVGIKAVAIEREERRFKAMQAIHAAIAKEYPEVAEKFKLLFAPFPSESVKANIDSMTIAIATNFIATITPAQQLEIIQSMADYSTAFIDVQRFCEKRCTHEEYQDLINTFLENGFTNAEEVLDLGNGGIYYRLDK